MRQRFRWWVPDENDKRISRYCRLFKRWCFAQLIIWAWNRVARSSCGIDFHLLVTMLPSASPHLRCLKWWVIDIIHEGADTNDDWPKRWMFMKILAERNAFIIWHDTSTLTKITIEIASILLAAPRSLIGHKDAGASCQCLSHCHYRQRPIVPSVTFRRWK